MSQPPRPAPHGPREPVTLANCDSEPIHIPGLVQPQGALFAFEHGSLRTTHASDNARALLGDSVPAPGEVLAPAHFGADPAVHAALAEAAAGETLADGAPANAEHRAGDRLFDVIAHRSGGRLVLEFERRPGARDDMADFAIKAHRAMDRLKRQASVEALLAMATESVRQLTGFDRVMAYRFRHDDSGEVVAEQRDDTLEPFLGRRYPASDIPAQARRLYVVNTLRLIADVAAEPVALRANAGQAPLDMSHAVLRSVSPIHIEYLRNMGVGASMSISIVVNGRLWGMLACHHRTALQVPYSVRMACDVLAQVLAANVQTLLAREAGRRAAEAGALRARLIEAVLHADDPFGALAPLAGELASAFTAGAVVVAEQSRLQVHGELPRDTAVALLRWLQSQPVPIGDDGILAHPSLAALPAALARQCGVWCGLMALRFDEPGEGWLLLLRKEQVETIHWGGKPEKHYAVGPNGPRLTPRGSFEVWKEEVRGTAEPWTADEVELARLLRDELVRANAARMAEIHRARTELFAVLGHDLRDPLQSITMAAKVLERAERAGGDAGGRISRRIQSSSSRMARLIGQVLDASRLQTGLGLQLQRAPVDLARLLEDLIDESRVAYPGVTLQIDAPASMPALADADRVTQLFANLVSNARHHGTPGEPVMVRLALEADQVLFVVRNASAPIDPELVPFLFGAFKRRSGANERNKGGLGLGLHIAQAIAQAHGGDIVYAHVDGSVEFRVRFPAQPAQPAQPAPEGGPPAP